MRVPCDLPSLLPKLVGVIGRPLRNTTRIAHARCAAAARGARYDVCTTTRPYPWAVGLFLGGVGSLTVPTLYPVSGSMPSVASPSPFFFALLGPSHPILPPLLVTPARRTQAAQAQARTTTHSHTQRPPKKPRARPDGKSRRCDTPAPFWGCQVPPAWAESQFIGYALGAGSYFG